MARRCVGVLAIIAALGTAVTPAGARSARSDASVTAIAPTVAVRERGAVEFADVSKTKPVGVGAEVRTGTHGLAQVDYGDGSFTRLDRQTKFVIKKLTDKTGKRQIETHLISGKTFNRVEKLSQSESFVQTTNGANSGVIGTTFAVAWTGKTQTSTYTLLKGTLILRIRGQKKPVRLTAGQRVTIVNGVPGHVETLTPQELCADPWICSNTGNTGYAQ